MNPSLFSLTLNICLFSTLAIAAPLSIWEVTRSSVRTVTPTRPAEEITVRSTNLQDVTRMQNCGHFFAIAGDSYEEEPDQSGTKKIAANIGKSAHEGYFGHAQSISFDKEGNIFVAQQSFPGSIQKLDRKTQLISEVLSHEKLANPQVVAVNSNGSVFFSSNGYVPQMYGLFSINPVSLVPNRIFHASGRLPIDFDSKENFIFVNNEGYYEYQLFRLDPNSSEPVSLAPIPNITDADSNDNGVISSPWSLVIDGNDTVYVALVSGQILKKDSSSENFNFIGNYKHLKDIKVAPDGDLYISQHFPRDNPNDLTGVISRVDKDTGSTEIPAGNLRARHPIASGASFHNGLEHFQTFNFDNQGYLYVVDGGVIYRGTTCGK